MATPQQIAQEWKGFDAGRRKELLAKMSPEEKGNLRSALEGKAKAPVAAAMSAPPPAVVNPAAPTPGKSPQQPGFFRRAGQALGVPTSKTEVQAMAKPSIGSLLLGPGYDLAKGYGKNLASQAKNLWKESEEAGENIGEGQPVGPNIGKVGAALTEAGLRGVLAPVGGGVVQTGGEDVATKNYAGAGGDVLGAVVNTLLLKGAGGPSDSSAVNRLTYATGDSAPEIAHTLSDLRQTVAETGTNPKTVQGLLDTVNGTKTRMNNESAQAMLPIAGQKTVPTAVADQIRSLITPNMKLTAQGRREIAQIKAAAVEFEKPWSYRELDAERMSARQRLKTFNDKNPVQQYGAKGANRTTAIDDAINRSIKSTIYPAMDRAAGKPAGYFASLKGRQSSLIDLESKLHDRVQKLTTATAKSKGAPRFSRENISAHVSGAGKPGFSLYGLMNVLHKPNAMASANRAVASALSGGSKAAKVDLAHLPVSYLLQQPDQQPSKPVVAALNAPHPQERDQFMAASNPKGLVEKGNIPIWNRPSVQNADGSHSSEYSTSFEDEQGREVLVPTVVDGKFLTPDGKKPPEGSAAEKAMFKAAWDHYLKTGENLGKFDNPDDADAYAWVLHNRGNP